MADTAFRDPGVERLPRASVPATEYAQYKAIRDKFKRTELRPLEPAIRASTVATLDGLPYPVKFRNQEALDGPARSSRKLIFVAPILIHADRLGGQAPAPKAYELTTGSVRPSLATGRQQQTKQRIQPRDHA